MRPGFLRPLALLALAALLVMRSPALAADDLSGTTPQSQPCPSCICYTSGYLFAVTRELKDTVESPAAVACLSPFTVVVDVALLPFEALLGVLQ